MKFLDYEEWAIAKDEEEATDQQLGKYDIEVANGYGYYNNTREYIGVKTIRESD